MAPRISVTPSGLAYVHDGPIYDMSVFNRDELLDAVQDLNNSGKTIMVRAGDYGPLTLSARHTSRTVLRAWPGEPVTIGPITMAGVNNMCFEGFDMPDGGFDTGQTQCQHLEMRRNFIHDCASTGLALWGGDNDILFWGNHVLRNHNQGQFYQGWGVVSRVQAGESITNIKIHYNTFDSLEDDAMELAGLDGFEIIGNEIMNVHVPPPPYPDPHPDGTMLWGGSMNGIYRDNRVHDGTGMIASGTTKNILVENNLIVRILDRGIDGGATASSSDAMESYTLRNNTIYDCGNYWNNGGFGGYECVSMTGNVTPIGPSNVMERNLFGSLNYWFAEQYLSTDHNLIQNGLRPGLTDIAYVPEFADFVNYLPINLPPGYEDVGYRYAPAGHLAV